MVHSTTLTCVCMLQILCPGVTFTSKVIKSFPRSCHGEAASHVIGCAVDPTLSCDLLYLSFESLI